MDDTIGETMVLSLSQKETKESLEEQDLRGGGLTCPDETSEWRSRNKAGIGDCNVLEVRFMSGSGQIWRTRTLNLTSTVNSPERERDPTFGSGSGTIGYVRVRFGFELRTHTIINFVLPYHSWLIFSK